MNGRAEKRAAEVLALIPTTLPIDVKLAASKKGLIVEAAELGEEVSGVLVVERGRGVIGYNASHALVRQRFTIAHELGHFTLHIQDAQLFIDKTYAVYWRDQVSSTGENRREVEANRFAAALLMPEELVRREMARLKFDLADEAALDGLATLFQVSRLAMSYRLANLGLLPRDSL